jgi:hypothetical protein
MNTCIRNQITTKQEQYLVAYHNEARAISTNQDQYQVPDHNAIKTNRNIRYQQNVHYRTKIYTYRTLTERWGEGCLYISPSARGRRSGKEVDLEVEEVDLEVDEADLEEEEADLPQLQRDRDGDEEEADVASESQQQYEQERGKLHPKPRHRGEVCRRLPPQSQTRAHC